MHTEEKLDNIRVSKYLQDNFNFNTSFHRCMQSSDSCQK